MHGAHSVHNFPLGWVSKQWEWRQGENTATNMRSGRAGHKS